MVAAPELFSRKRSDYSKIIPLFDDESEAQRLAILQLISEVRQTMSTTTTTLESVSDFFDQFRPRKISDENNLEVKMWNFNPIDNRTRFHELQSKLNKDSNAEEQEDIRQKKYAMLWGNFWTFLEEYVLFKPFTSFNYELSDVSQDQLTIEGFEFIGLTDLCEHSTEVYSQRKIRPTRLKIEQVIYGRLLHEIVHQLPIGTEFFICSPPGNRKEGYLGRKSYSFIFFYKIVKNPKTGQKSVELHQYSRWMDLQDHVDFIKEFGGQFDENVQVNDKNIILHPSLLKKGYSEADVVNYLERFRSRVPKNHRQREINETKFKQQAELIFDQFYFPQFDELAQQPLTQELVEKMELALSFSIRGLLRWIDEDEKFQTGKSDNMARDISVTKDIPQLKTLFKTQVKATIEKTLKFATEAEKQAHLSGLRFQFGNNIGSILQAGQCYGGALVNLTGKLDVLTQFGKINSRFDIAKIVGSKEAKDWKKGICVRKDCKNHKSQTETWIGPCSWCSDCDGRFHRKSTFNPFASLPSASAIKPASSREYSTPSTRLTPETSVGLGYLFSGAAA